MSGNPLLNINNLSDVSDSATARINLDVDSKEEGQARIDALSSELADSEVGLGDALIGIKQPFDDAIARTQHDFNAQYVSVLDFGAVADGDTDDTAAFIDAIASGAGYIYVPTGTYKLSLNTITLASHSHIEISVGAMFNLTNTVSSSASGGAAWLFKIVGSTDETITDVRILGGRYVSDDDRIVIVSVNSYVDGVNIEGMICDGPRVLYVTDGNDAYASSTSDTRPKNVCTIGNRGTIKTRSTSNAFIELRYLDGGTIDKNIIDGYYHSIEFWGGNSNPNSNGVLTNERKCTSLVITRNICGMKVKCYKAGIWGSMGLAILVSNNIVIGSGDSNTDVGIDMEGCINCSVIGNFAQDFLNGNLATFFYCRQVTFTGNTSRCTVSGVVAARINNSAANRNNRQISFVCNMFWASNFVSSIVQSGAVDALSITDNQFINVNVTLLSNNNGALIVSGNKFHYTVAPTAASISDLSGFDRCCAIAFGRYQSVECNENIFRSETAWPSGSTPIYGYHASTTSRPLLSAKGNRVIDTMWSYDFVIENQSINAGGFPQFDVSDMQVAAQAYMTIANGSTGIYPQGFFYAKDAYGRPWPQSAPSDVWLSRGQRFFNTLSAAISGYEATIVTTAGVVGGAAVIGKTGAIVAL